MDGGEDAMTHLCTLQFFTFSNPQRREGIYLFTGLCELPEYHTHDFGTAGIS